ncbi:MAG: glutamate synthase-related protein [Nitrososphaerales archaeon]
MSQARLVKEYMRIPPHRDKEFWHVGRIVYLRRLSQNGRAVRLWTPYKELCNRPLDRIRFLGVKHDIDEVPAPLNGSPSTDPSVNLAYSRIQLTSPLYLGDMSFGALSGIPNIALARTADITGVITGTGEGGLHPEVKKCKRITVQWASARFGVDMDVLNAGLGIVIKIGQGAKPGIGGHLPGSKVTESISLTRRIPIGRDAISPAPHHDIYSIEDLGQRIWALKEATGKPVFVKVGVTNYIPYIASGVARMGGDGIIMDAGGAGTGASPSVVRDNVGLPIELAVASVDRILRREGLREGFSVIAAGRVSNAEDTVKLMALGADCVSIGTASLISMGCLMVHKCHIGFCPTLITNKIVSNPAKVLDLDWATKCVVNLIRGWTEEIQLILEFLGIKKVSDLVGRRDLLRGYNMNDETLEILGIERAEESYGSSLPLMVEEELWIDYRKKWLQEISGTVGKTGSEARITSMGNISPPFVNNPGRIVDWLVSDGAQVTRPSIDPYREEIETSIYLGKGKLRLSSPIIFAPFREDLPLELLEIFLRVTNSMGLLMDMGERLDLPFDERYFGRIIVNEICKVKNSAGIVLNSLEAIKDYEKDDRFKLIRLPSRESSIKLSVEATLKGFDAIIIDEDLKDSDLPAELVISDIDRALRSILKDNLPLRNFVNLILVSSKVRGSDDIFKLMGLGADAVGLSKAALIALGLEDIKVDKLYLNGIQYRLENLIFAIQKEIKLLAGAAGVSNLFTSLVGNRELFRSVDLDPKIRKRLGVKPAGVG